MGHDRAEVRHDVLERLDLALAARLAAGDGDVVATSRRQRSRWFESETGDDHWVAATLGLRGLRIRPEDVAAVLFRTPGRFKKGQQEHALILGMKSVLQVMRNRASHGVPPTGWFLVDLFRVLTTEVRRFRRNALRGDHPWDGLLHVTYPEADQLRGLLDSFTEEGCYRDIPARFRSLHPVRQSFRLMWRFARLAPFPDFNIPMAFVGMNAFLMSKGYPLMTAENQDRELLAKVISGPPPRRLTQFESRLLRRIEPG